MRDAGKFLFVCLLASGFCVPAFAQTKTPAVPAATGKDQPMEITADQTLEWHRNDLQYIARERHR